MNKDPWNKCMICGKFIPYKDFESGKALNRMVKPDSSVSFEEWEIMCKDCNKKYHLNYYIIK